MKLAQAMVLGVALAGIAGCQQYSTYPNIPTARGMSENPNNPAGADAMIQAVRYVATRYSPGSPTGPLEDEKAASDPTVPFPMVVNLPRGMRRSFYERIAREIGPHCAPMTADADPALPVYHVTRVWLRFSSGEVDVLRPMPELGPDASGHPVYQAVTVRLEGGFEPWHVVHARAWPAGEAQVPVRYCIPDVERVDQYEVEKLAAERDNPGTTDR